MIKNNKKLQRNKYGEENITYQRMSVVHTEDYKT